MSSGIQDIPSWLPTPPVSPNSNMGLMDEGGWTYPSRTTHRYMLRPNGKNNELALAIAVNRTKIRSKFRPGDTQTDIDRIVILTGVDIDKGNETQTTIDRTKHRFEDLPVVNPPGTFRGGRRLLISQRGEVVSPASIKIIIANPKGLIKMKLRICILVANLKGSHRGISVLLVRLKNWLTLVSEETSRMVGMMVKRRANRYPCSCVWLSSLRTGETPAGIGPKRQDIYAVPLSDPAREVGQQADSHQRQILDGGGGAGTGDIAARGRAYFIRASPALYALQREMSWICRTCPPRADVADHLRYLALNEIFNLVYLGEGEEEGWLTSKRSNPFPGLGATRRSGSPPFCQTIITVIPLTTTSQSSPLALLPLAPQETAVSTPGCCLENNSQSWCLPSRYRISGASGARTQSSSAPSSADDTGWQALLDWHADILKAVELCYGLAKCGFTITWANKPRLSSGRALHDEDAEQAETSNYSVGGPKAHDFNATLVLPPPKDDTNTRIPPSIPVFVSKLRYYPYPIELSTARLE
ncbi:hypothetical protein BKA70DRAFT_1404312 [Coprinopsis sp. MPI-PUGE-AT-0042]|nr:hypothetical protein BKA70DRAFT_1404312 [Coprinopsis sp. MPI-PUGE-AT-0042]